MSCEIEGLGGMDAAVSVGANPVSMVGALVGVGRL